MNDHYKARIAVCKCGASYTKLNPKADKCPACRAIKRAEQKRQYMADVRNGIRKPVDLETRRLAKVKWYKARRCAGVAHAADRMTGISPCGQALDPERMVPAEVYTSRCDVCYLLTHKQKQKGRGIIFADEVRDGTFA